MNTRDLDLQHIKTSLKIKLRKFNNTQQNTILLGDKGIYKIF